MALRESGLGKAYYRRLEAWVLPLVERTGVSPGGISLLGVLTAVLVPPAFWLHPFAGVGCMLVSGVLDNLDGLLSRARGESGRLGDFLDSTLDRFSDVLYLTGFWVLLWGLPRGQLIAGSLLVMAALSVTLLAEYTRERIEALGATCTGGLFGRPERVIFLLVLGVGAGAFPGRASWLLWAGLAVYVVLGGITVVQRFQVAGKSLEL